MRPIGSQDSLLPRSALSSCRCEARNQPSKTSLGNTPAQSVPQNDASMLAPLRDTSLAPEPGLLDRTTKMAMP